MEPSLNRNDEMYARFLSEILDLVFWHMREGSRDVLYLGHCSEPEPRWVLEYSFEEAVKAVGAQEAVDGAVQVVK